MVVVAGVCCVVVVLEAGCSVVVVLVAGAEPAGASLVVWEQADSATRATLARHGRMNFFMWMIVIWIVIPLISSAIRQLVPGQARAKAFQVGEVKQVGPHLRFEQAEPPFYLSSHPRRIILAAAAPACLPRTGA